jgi:hypothetical protein
LDVRTAPRDADEAADDDTDTLANIDTSVARDAVCVFTRSLGHLMTIGRSLFIIRHFSGNGALFSFDLPFELAEALRLRTVHGRGVDAWGGGDSRARGWGGVPGRWGGRSGAMMEESSPGGDDGFGASFGAMSLAGGSGDSMKNPLFESDPSDTDERRRSRDGQTSPGGIGRGWTEAPESHLRRVRAGGLLTKLPFDAKGTPRVRFFRVAASDRELQWGDPADAASPTLGSRLLLHEVQSVARGHATRAFEAHARADPKRAGPPAECFSLVAKDADSCDLRGGDTDDAALWAGAL